MSMPSEITFFIDCSISQKTVPIALQAAGVTVKTLVDHFPMETTDVEWLREVSQRGWVVLTKDKKIESRPLEVEAIAHGGARVFILVSGNLTSQQMAKIFVDVLGKLKKVTQGHKAPFIAKVYKDGRVQVWKNRQQLLKFIR